MAESPIIVAMWFLLLMRSGSLCLLWANRAHWSKDIYQEAVLDSVTLCLESLPKLSQVSCEYSCQTLGTICRQKSLSTGTMWESNFCLHNTWHMFGNKPVIQCFSFWGDIQNLNSNIGDFKKEHEALWCKETPFFFEIQNEMYYMEIIFQGTSKQYDRKLRE